MENPEAPCATCPYPQVRGLWIARWQMYALAGTMNDMTSSRRRLFDLYALRERVEAEIRALETIGPSKPRRQRRSRFTPPPHGTEPGYQWHRNPKNPDTCEACLTAHRIHERKRARAARATRQDRREDAA